MLQKFCITNVIGSFAILNIYILIISSVVLQLTSTTTHAMDGDVIIREQCI